MFFILITVAAKEEADTSVKPESEPLEEEDNNEDFCGICNSDENEKVVMICCDGCPKVFHLNCHVPALSEIPLNKWRCMFCTTKKECVKYDELQGIRKSILPQRGIKNCTWSDFYLACKLLCEIFKLEESYILRENVPATLPVRKYEHLHFISYSFCYDVVAKSLLTLSQGISQMKIRDLNHIRKRLTHSQPTSFSDMQSYVRSFKKLTLHLKLVHNVCYVFT